MLTEFPTVRLGDHAEKIGSGATPRGGKDVYLTSGIALIRSQNVYNNRFSYDGLAYISNEHADQLSNVTVQPDDILLNITGDSVARVCQVPQAVLPARVNQHVAIIRPLPSSFDLRYLRYFLVSPYMQAYMLSLAGSGGTRNALTKGMIENFRVPRPSIDEQRAVAHILGTLDDRIELNRQLNQTLEAIARAIFKSWFVDFDPVWANMEGRPYPLDPATLALFPDTFQESELGDIPAGWCNGQLGDIVGFQSGYAFSSKDWQDTGVPVVKIGSVKPGIVDLSQVSYVSDKVAAEQRHYRLGVGDLLIGMTGYVGEVGLVPPTDTLPLLNQRVGKLVLPGGGIDELPFVYCLTRDPEFKARVENRAHGTAQANVSAKAILSIETVIPPDNIRAAFNGSVLPLLKRILHNHAESKTLADLRDTLLPKLISGELRVPAAAELVHEVAS